MTELLLKSGHSTASGEMMGENNKTFTSFKEGLAYLRDYPFGTLEHPDMNILAFLYVKNDGRFGFVDVARLTKVQALHTEEFIDSLLSEDDLKDFEDPESWEQSKWVYMDGSEMACRIGGIAWFDSLRADLSLSDSPSLPSL